MMAHADYDCCAVCDSKLSYSNEPLTKEEICSSCSAALVKHGVIVASVSELLAWAHEEEIEKLRDVLCAVGYTFCLYHNPLDFVVASRFGLTEIEPGGQIVLERGLLSTLLKKAEYE